MAKKKKNKLKQRDVHGRTPKQILDHFEGRFILTYDVILDKFFCCQRSDVKGLEEIRKYENDRMELVRHRDPVYWAAKMMELSKKQGEK